MAVNVDEDYEGQFTHLRVYTSKKKDGLAEWPNSTVPNEATINLVEHSTDGGDLPGPGLFPFYLPEDSNDAEVIMLIFEWAFEIYWASGNRIGLFNAAMVITTINGITLATVRTQKIRQKRKIHVYINNHDRSFIESMCSVSHVNVDIVNYTDAIKNKIMFI